MQFLQHSRCSKHSCWFLLVVLICETFINAKPQSVQGNAFAGKSSPIERRLGKILEGEVEIASDCLALCRQLPVLLLLPSSGFVVGCSVANTPTSLFTMLLFQKGEEEGKGEKDEGVRGVGVLPWVSF